MTDNISDDILTHACILSCSKEGTHMSLQAFSFFILNILFILFLQMSEYLFVYILRVLQAAQSMLDLL